MTVEDRLREALRARADGVVAAEPEWSRVADRFSRRRRWRSAASLPILAGVALLLVAVVIWVDPGSDAARPLRTAGPPPTVGAPATPALPPVPDVQGPPAQNPDVFGGRVLPGFQPMSTTWTSSLQGWLLGEVAWCSTPPCKYLLRTTDGGNTWKGAPAPSPPGSGRGTIRFADERNGWIYGEEWALATHNGGSTWSAVNGLPGKVTSLESSEERAWAILDSAGGASVFTSAVGTDDWRPASGPVRPTGSLVLQDSGGYVVGVDGSVLALSHPGGRARPGEPAVVERRGRPCAGGTASLAPAGSDLFALCVGLPAAGSADKTLMVSSDGARTWSTVGNPPRGGSASGLAAASRSTIVVWAVGGASRLYRSVDGGVTWTTVYDNSNGGAFSDLGFTSASRGSVMLGSPPTSSLLQTSDGGRTWSPVVLTP